MSAAARILLRPIGNPLPLGFLPLAGETLMVSGLQLGWLEPALGRDVALILIGFVFPLQLLAAVFGFLGRDVVAGTGMGILAGTWLSVGLVSLTSPPGSTSDALGLFLLVAGVAMLVPASPAGVGKLVAFAVLTTTALRFTRSPSAHRERDLGGRRRRDRARPVRARNLRRAGDGARTRPEKPGYPCCAAARDARRSRGGLDDQLAHIEREAGVRQQL